MHLTKSRTLSAPKRLWGITTQQKKSSSKPMLPQQAFELPHYKTRNQLLCQQNTNRHRIKICQHRKRTPCSRVWMWTFPHLPLWSKFCSRIRPQAAGVYTDEKFSLSTSKATKNASPITAIRCHHQIPSRQPNACGRCRFKALLWWIYAHTRSERSSTCSMPTIFKWILVEKTRTDILRPRTSCSQRGCFQRLA